jgi:hypothetical protein
VKRGVHARHIDQFMNHLLDDRIGAFLERVLAPVAPLDLVNRGPAADRHSRDRD